MSKRLSACVFAVLASCPVLRAAFLPDTFEAMVPMRDGVRLFTYGTKPKKGEKVPIVIVRNPYVSELAPGEVTSFAFSQKAALRHGYAGNAWRLPRLGRQQLRRDASAARAGLPRRCRILRPSRNSVRADGSSLTRFVLPKEAK